MKLFLQRRSYEEWRKILPHYRLEILLILALSYATILIIIPWVPIDIYLRNYNSTLLESVSLLYIPLSLISLYYGKLLFERSFRSFAPLLTALMDHLIEREQGIITPTSPGDKPPELMVESFFYRLVSAFCLIGCVWYLIFTLRGLFGFLF